MGQYLAKECLDSDGEVSQKFHSTRTRHPRKPKVPTKKARLKMDPGDDASDSYDSNYTTDFMDSKSSSDEMEPFTNAEVCMSNYSLFPNNNLFFSVADVLLSKTVPMNGRTSQKWKRPTHHNVTIEEVEDEDNPHHVSM